jgi:hypothetical protein
LKGVPTANLEPQIVIVKDATLLGPRFMEMDFALQTHFEANGEVKVNGGTDEDVSEWEVGFLQSVLRKNRLFMLFILYADI